MTSDVEVVSKPIDVKALIEKIKKVSPDKTPTILVVDDEESSRLLISHALKKAGWTAIEAANGGEALQKLNTHKPTVILLDLLMPEMDGFEVIMEIHRNEKWRNIPIIVITAKNMTPEESLIVNRYSKGLFQKEKYSMERLIAMIIVNLKNNSN